MNNRQRQIISFFFSLFMSGELQAIAVTNKKLTFTRQGDFFVYDLRTEHLALLNDHDSSIAQNYGPTPIETIGAYITRPAKPERPTKPNLHLVNIAGNPSCKH